jgi:ribosomal protein S25
LGLAVQTNGTVTDTVDRAEAVVDKILDAAIDDVFGYQLLSNFKLSKTMPIDSGYSTSTSNTMVEMSVILPPNLLGLINKEVETERLQNLYIVLVGSFNVNNQAINIFKSFEVDYTNVRKTITLR